ncbi:hypothetical protein N431DRAFT_448977 [Stipitochalara longipes BDJ]|nr:hypothetical protein N431DRAFT_448977 [Stipitochalara longipes BDJ]
MPERSISGADDEKKGPASAARGSSGTPQARSPARRTARLLGRGEWWNCEMRPSRSGCKEYVEGPGFGTDDEVLILMCPPSTQGGREAGRPGLAREHLFLNLRPPGAQPAWSISRIISTKDEYAVQYGDYGVHVSSSASPAIALDAPRPRPQMPALDVLIGCRRSPPITPVMCSHSARRIYEVKSAVARGPLSYQAGCSAVPLPNTARRLTGCGHFSPC